MLSSIRNAFSQGILRYVLMALMGLLVCSFAIWGIGDVVRKGGSSDVAQVGRINISLQEYQAAYQRETRQISKQMQRPLSQADIAQMGIDRYVLNKLITDALLDSKIAEMKLSLSDEAISERIRTSPSYKGSTGQFDRFLFNDVIRDMGLSEAGYIEQERKLALRQQLASSITGIKTPPQTLLAAVNVYRNEKRTVDYVLITAKEVGAPTIPTKQDLTTFFEERKLSFRAPEYRKVTLVRATKATLEQSLNVTDDELKAAYDKAIPVLTTPEKRTLERVTLKAGETKTFDELAKEQAATLNYGTFAMTEIIDSNVAKAAFILKEGEISEPLDSTFGKIILRLKAITPASIQTFDAVKTALKANISTERFRNKIYDLQDKLDKERASGLPLADIAPKIGLIAEKIETDRMGRTPSGVAHNIEESDLVLKEIFDSSINAERDALQIKEGGGYIWVEVNAIIPARDRKEEEVSNDLAARYIENQLRINIIKLADNIVKQVETGVSLETASQQKPQTTGELTRLSNDITFSATALETVFTTPVSKAGTAPSRDLVDRIVFKVNSSQSPALDNESKDIKDLSTSLAKSYEDDILTQYIAALKKQFTVTINESNYKRAAGGGRLDN